jgi:drug/metabolite transporter (DMT)-like permease
MDDAKKNALIETLKSVGRGLWFGVLGLIAVALTALATSGAVSDITVVVAGVSINLSFVILAVVGFVAKTIDTYIHKNDNLDSNGIAPSFLQK